ncbi:MAG: type II toxin-antitoxin system VapC family toxin [Nitrospiraceae bacterium]
MKFWDASAIIPLCLEEPPTPRLKKLAEEDSALIVWWGTPIECFSALARRRREAILSSAEEEQARSILIKLLDEWTEIEPSREIRERAGRILLVHSLRAADSLQLAAALVWANGRPTGHEFVCIDQKLRDAAQREGFTILPVL